MKPVVRYEAAGRFRGMVQRLRPHQGEQMWLIRFTLVLPPDDSLQPGDKGYGEDVNDIREVLSKKPLRITELGAYANSCISDLFPGGFALGSQAKWEAFAIPKAHQKKKPKARRAA